MRAKEFVKEGKKGKITNRQGRASVGVGKFGDVAKADRIYTLDRVMRAAACSDGKTKLSKNENAPNDESWAGKQNTFHPYTEVEQKMIQQALNSVNGGSYTDLAKGDLRSQELPDTHKQSPVTGFKGY